MKRFFFITLSVLLSITSIVYAAAPKLIPYQGQLYEGTSQAGGDAGNFYVFRFGLYNAPASGTKVWDSGNVTTTVQRGFYSVNLGDPTLMTVLPDTIFDGISNLWLDVQAVQAGSGSFISYAPRKKIAATPYAKDSLKLGGILAKEYQRKWTNVVTVAPGGPAAGANFSSIAAGIANAASRATMMNRYLVLVAPGTYFEPPMISAQYVDLVGISRDGCIIMGTYTVFNNVLIENLTFDPGPGATAIDIQGGNPTLNTLNIISGNTGINIMPGASPTLHNIDAQSNVAVVDQGGAVIDGLRSMSQAINAMFMDPAEYDYKNIIQYGGGLNSIMIFDLVGSGKIRSVHAASPIAITACNDLRMRDIHVTPVDSMNPAIFIGDVIQNCFISDGYISSPVMPGIQIVNTMPPMGTIELNDLSIISQFGDGIQIDPPTMSPVSIMDTEIEAVSGRGIFCSTNAAGEFPAQVYVQSCWFTTGIDAIDIDGATEFWVYDTTIRNLMGASILGNNTLPPLTPMPRIADCRFETDTMPSQGIGGTPGWNALGGTGNAFGTGEDSRGNLIAPFPGTPVGP